MDEIDAELTKLIPDYIEARRRDVVALRAHLADHRLEDIRRIAHRMKGTGATYGLAEVTRLGDALETAAQSADEPAVGTLIDELDETLRRLQ